MRTDPLFNIVLIEPEIPSNTGNIGRTCLGLEMRLHLVGPLGFVMSDKQLKRAGLDYWQHVDWYQYPDYDAWAKQVPDFSRVRFFSTKVATPHFAHRFRRGDWLVFGRETRGLDEALLARYPDQCLTLPMPGTIRSLNLATAVGIAAFEGLRQVVYGG